MYKITKNGDNTASATVEIVADLLTDVDILPKNVGAGSSCIVLENSSVWMMGNDGEWHQL